MIRNHLIIVNTNCNSEKSKVIQTDPQKIAVLVRTDLGITNDEVKVIYDNSAVGIRDIAMKSILGRMNYKKYLNSKESKDIFLRVNSSDELIEILDKADVKKFIYFKTEDKLGNLKSISIGPGLYSQIYSVTGNLQDWDL